MKRQPRLDQGFRRQARGRTARQTPQYFALRVPAHRSAATSAGNPRGRSAACHYICTALSVFPPRRPKSRCGTDLLLLAGPRSLRSGCASPGVVFLVPGAVSSRAPRPAGAVRRGPTAGSPAPSTRARLAASRRAWPLLGSPPRNPWAPVTRSSSSSITSWPSVEVASQLCKKLLLAALLPIKNKQDNGPRVTLPGVLSRVSWVL